jgi:hypothetical protein
VRPVLLFLVALALACNASDVKNFSGPYSCAPTCSPGLAPFACGAKVWLPGSNPTADPPAAQKAVWWCAITYSSARYLTAEMIDTVMLPALRKAGLIPANDNTGIVTRIACTGGANDRAPPRQPEGIGGAASCSSFGGAGGYGLLGAGGASAPSSGAGPDCADSGEACGVGAGCCPGLVCYGTDVGTVCQ